ncbi:MAG TPA: radical SAM protein [Elusimicrobiota bacterium]|nr:radical SAM protein [Elusimicrobiota bacterium]
MKVGLVQSPVWWTIDPPLGLAQVAGCLRAAGHEVAVWDLNILLWKNRLPQYENMWLWEQYQFWNHPDIVDRFFEDNREFIDKTLEGMLSSDCRLFGFSIYAGTQRAALRLAQRLKEADSRRRVVFGGQYFFRGPHAEEMLRTGFVDAVVRGAGDELFPQLAADLERTGLPRKRAGLLFRDGADIVDGGPAESPKNLDALPFPDFSGFPMDLYTDKTRIPVAASRGCVLGCRFCSSREFWPHYSGMSGERIFAELKHQKAMFPQRAHFEFYDLTANGRPENLYRFALLAADFMIQHRPERNFRWKINAIVRPEMTRDYLAVLKAGGCQDIIYGIESGSPDVLWRMNKNYDPAVADRVLQATHEVGIRTVANFMFGFPGETEEDFQLTLDFLRRNRPWLDMAYGSATFTSLEEYSYLAEHPREFDIRQETAHTAHNLYWDSLDGKNTYPVRLDRYARFRRTCRELGLDAYKGLDGALELDRLANLAHYYQYRDRRLEAIGAYVDYLERDRASRPMREQLRRYQGDLRLLVKALRLVERANRLLLSANGALREGQELLRRTLESGELLAMPGSSRGEIDRVRLYVARAQRFLRRLTHGGGLRWGDRGLVVCWEKEPAPPLEELRALRSKVDRLIELSESEEARTSPAAVVPGAR